MPHGGGIQSSDVSGSYAEARQRIRSHPDGEDALYVLDIIDTKVSSVFTYIGILTAALLIFVSRTDQDPSFELIGITWQQSWFVLAALATILVASMLCLSCVNLIDIRDLQDESKLDTSISKVSKIAHGRRQRYLVALRLTAVSVILTSIVVIISL